MLQVRSKGEALFHPGRQAALAAPSELASVSRAVSRLDAAAALPGKSSENGGLPAPFKVKLQPKTVVILKISQRAAPCGNSGICAGLVAVFFH